MSRIKYGEISVCKHYNIDVIKHDIYAMSTYVYCLMYEITYSLGCFNNIKLY